jgi:hypothetical protein
MASGRNVLRILLILTLLGSLLACSKPPVQTAAAPARPSELAAIPEPDPARYPDWHNLKDWKNPYLVVREDGIGLLDTANSELHILKPEEVPAALIALPDTAWPYGRVVLVAEAMPKNASEQTKSDLRKNRGLLVGTLKDLKVLIHEVP